MKMPLTPETRRTAWRIAELAAPMMLARAGLLVMVAVDTAMIGHAGVGPLAEFGIANAMHVPALVVMIGLLTSVLILSSQAIGAGRPGETARIWLIGCGLAIICGILTGLFLWFGEPVLGWLGQPPELAVGGGEVMRAFAPGMPAIALYIANIFLLESLGRPKIGLGIVVAGNLVNVLGNMILIREGGNAAVEATIATSATRWLMAILALMAVIQMAHKGALVVRGTIAEYLSVLRRMLKKGGPVAIAQYLESASFNGTVIFAGWIGANAVAAMQIAYNVLAIIFMLSLGIGAAASVEVGRATGAGDMTAVRRSGWTALGLNIAAMLALTPFLLIGAGEVAALYTDDPVLIPLATTAVAITALVLIADGGQAVITGALRGFGDVTFGTIAYLVAFGVCALPLAWLLGVHLDLGTPGLLYGLFTGLFLLMVMLVSRFAWITRPGQSASG